MPTTTETTTAKNDEQASPTPQKAKRNQITISGVVNVNKPAGLTSHDVVTRCRRVFNMKKVGHGGTLDPQATGVLPIFLGHATRLIEYMPDDKHYEAIIRFGRATNTWDGEGEETASADASALTQAQLEAMLPQYTGKIQQTVPPFSAVHVNGKKLYHYARKGIEVELPVREAEIFALDLLEVFDLGTPAPACRVRLHVASGTYVRAIAHEMGEALGCYAHLETLVRTQHGKFAVEDSVDLDTLLALEDPEQAKAYVQSPLEAIQFEQIDLGTQAAEKVKTGQKLLAFDHNYPVRRNQLYCLIYKNSLLAIAKAEQAGKLSLEKVFTAQ